MGLTLLPGALAVALFRADSFPLKESLWHVETSFWREGEEKAAGEGGYWYQLAIRGLVLDRVSGSATLEVPPHVERARVRPFSRAGGPHEGIRTPTIDSL